jgi:hypothetical protein
VNSAEFAILAYFGNRRSGTVAAEKNIQIRTTLRIAGGESFTVKLWLDKTLEAGAGLNTEPIFSS